MAGTRRLGERRRLDDSGAGPGRGLGDAVPSAAATAARLHQRGWRGARREAGCQGRAGRSPEARNLGGLPLPHPQRGWQLCLLFGLAPGTSSRRCGGSPAVPELSASPFRRPLSAGPQAAGRDAPAGPGGRLRQLYFLWGHCLTTGEQQTGTF